MQPRHRGRRSNRVELAGAIAELARRALAKDFRNIDPRAARDYPDSRPDRACCRTCLRTFPTTPGNDSSGLASEVRLNAPVTAVDATG